ncbi:hypothetical protein K449DRAFT_460583 [Hypoxylon sp. EC38]|nr:hypothetical protein K449DRAFT_460583 [Hypoxylon sp. EC38]
MSSENDQSGTDRNYVLGDVPEFSSLSEALDEIIQGDFRTKRGVKRKRDDTQTSGPAAAVEDSERLESDDVVVVWRPLVHSAQTQGMGRSLRDELAHPEITGNLEVRGDNVARLKWLREKAGPPPACQRSWENS